MDITEERLRAIVTQVVSEYLKATQGSSVPAPEEKTRAYVLCEAGREEQFLSYLRQNKSGNRLDVIAVLEAPEGDLVRTLLEEGLCSVISAPNSKTDPAVCLTIYPTFSRSALCEAALGMDHCFSSSFLRRDFEEGRRSVVMMKGLDPFTGKEPAAYREKILSYIREMVRMEVRFAKPGEETDKAQSLSAGGASSGPARTEEKTAGKAGKPAAPLSTDSGKTEILTLTTKNNIISAMDLRRFPVGSRIRITDRKIITPLAKDVIRDRKLTILGT